jgi:hypothetical protein
MLRPIDRARHADFSTLGGQPPRAPHAGGQATPARVDHMPQPGVSLLDRCPSDVGADPAPADASASSQAGEIRAGGARSRREEIRASGPDEVQEVRVELILEAADQAVRGAGIDLQGRVHDELRRLLGRGANGHDAGPELATATAISYLHVYNKHIRPLAGHRPLERFELPGPVTEVLGQMAAAGVGQATRDRVRKVLSSAFGWGVETGRMRANGVRSVRPNRRRSRRLPAAEARSAGRQDGVARRKAWAVSPEAFAALHRGALDRRTPGRALWLPARDAIAVSMLYGLGLRPQELFGATFRQASRARFRVEQGLTTRLSSSTISSATSSHAGE